MPTTAATTAASASASSSAASSKRGRVTGNVRRYEGNMTGPQPSLALRHESPSQRGDPPQRLVAAEQLQTLEQPGRDRAARDRDTHRPEQHARLEIGLVAGAAQCLLD